jgi:hypothetical protein
MIEHLPADYRADRLPGADAASGGERESFRVTESLARHVCGERVAQDDNRFSYGAREQGFAAVEFQTQVQTA